MIEQGHAEPHTDDERAVKRMADLAKDDEERRLRLVPTSDAAERAYAERRAARAARHARERAALYTKKVRNA